MNAEMQGKAIVKFVDVWKHAEAADGFPIQVIPTQVLINADGTPYVPSEAMDDSGIEFSMLNVPRSYLGEKPRPATKVKGTPKNPGGCGCSGGKCC